jgi:hypothetical protein
MICGDVTSACCSEQCSISSLQSFAGRAKAADEDARLDRLLHPIVRGNAFRRGKRIDLGGQIVAKLHHHVLAHPISFRFVQLKTSRARPESRHVPTRIGLSRDASLRGSASHDWPGSC